MLRHWTTARTLLLATASTIALTVYTPRTLAADLPQRKVVTKAPVVKAETPAQTNWFVEGAAFWTAGNPGHFFFGPTEIKPRVGWEGAIGFDHRFPSNSPAWHVSAQFRYGKAGKTSRSLTGEFTVPGYPSIDVYTGNVEHKERHWVADFAVGRDMGLGTPQVKLGLRVAEIKTKTDFSGMIYGTSLVTANQRSRFLGYGPRLGLDGTSRLSGNWAFEYMAGIAGLYGRRSLDISYLDTYNTESFAAAFSDHAWIFNLDASAGLSYLLTNQVKFTAGYRFDGYWKAIKTFDAGSNIVNVDRHFHGPFVRLGGQF